MYRLPGLICLLLAAGPVTAAPRTSTPGSLADRCAPAASRTAGQGPAQVRKLGEEPPAAQLRTVYRTDVDGCPVPVVLREGIGARRHKASPLVRGVTLHPVR